MRRRGRVRRVGKWGGTILCLTIMTTWLGSTFLFLRIPYRSNAAVAFRGGGILLLRGRSETGGPMEWTIRRETGFGLGLHPPYSGSATAGCVLLLIVDVASVWWSVSWTSQPQDRLVIVFAGQIAVLSGTNLINIYDPGWYVYRLSTPDIRWWPTIWIPNPPAGPTISVGIPLWIPLVVVAIPTGLLWRRERKRPRPGHCRSCGYNLTGNVSGVCPECGEKV